MEKFIEEYKKLIEDILLLQASKLLEERQKQYQVYDQ